MLFRSTGQGMPVEVREAVFCCIDMLEDSLSPKKMLLVTCSGHLGTDGNVNISVRVLDAPL